LAKLGEGEDPLAHSGAQKRQAGRPIGVNKTTAFEQSCDQEDVDLAGVVEREVRLVDGASRFVASLMPRG
jgi:hypothetical protein